MRLQNYKVKTLRCKGMIIMQTFGSFKAPIYKDTKTWDWFQFPKLKPVFFSFGHQQVQILVYQSLNCIKSDKNWVQANWTILDLLILNVNEWKIISWYLIPYHTLGYARAVQAIVGVLWISICFVGSSHTRAQNRYY